MILKQIPEDFIVEEIPSKTWSQSGDYSIVKVTKKNKNTIDVVQKIAQALKIPQKSVGFAGMKDKNAITTQYMSVKASKQAVQNVQFQDISIEFVAYDNQPLSLGELSANKFTIVVRNAPTLLQEITTCVNYFGEQRFSTNNVEIGRSIIKQEFKKTVELLKNDAQRTNNEQFLTQYQKNPNDAIGILRTVQKKLLTLLISSYQSHIWNTMASTIVAKNAHRVVDTEFGKLCFPTTYDTNMQLPMVGFATTMQDHYTEILTPILEAENITTRSFIIKPFPELSSEGSMRSLYTPVNDCHIKQENDTQIVSFTLEKSAYATIVLRAMSIQ